MSAILYPYVCVCECLCCRGWLSISKLAKSQMVLIVVVQSAKCDVDFVCLVWLRRQGRMQYIQEKKWPGVPNPKSLPLLLSMSPECFHSTNSPTHKYTLKKSHTHTSLHTHTHTVAHVTSQQISDTKMFTHFYCKTNHIPKHTQHMHTKCHCCSFDAKENGMSLKNINAGRYTLENYTPKLYVCL